MVETAAVAMLIGIDDPIAFLANSGSDWDIAVAVVRRAQEMQFERRSAELRAVVDAIGASVGNRVGEVVMKALAAAFR